MFTTDRPATHVTDEGFPAFLRAARFWDADAKMSEAFCAHCYDEFRLFEPVWVRNEIGLLTPYCQDLDECAERMQERGEYWWSFPWNVFERQIMAALGLQPSDKTFNPRIRLEVKFEIEETRVMVELEGRHDLIEPETIRHQFSGELIKEIWAEDKNTNPAAPGLSLRQRAWAQWRIATVAPHVISNPMVLDMLWCAYRGDENAMQEVAKVFRLNGVIIYDAPKANNGRGRKQARKHNAKKAHAKSR